MLLVVSLDWRGECIKYSSVYLQKTSQCSLVVCTFVINVLCWSVLNHNYINHSSEKQFLKKLFYSSCRFFLHWSKLVSLLARKWQTKINRFSCSLIWRKSSKHNVRCLGISMKQENLDNLKFEAARTRFRNCMFSHFCQPSVVCVLL